MKASISAFVTGGLFGLGLSISGMTLPQKVIGFFDIFGDWDPTLVVVLASALSVYLLFLKATTRRGKPLFETALGLPPKRTVDARLILGSVLFGAGWGLGGYCPGPTIVSAGAGAPAALWFGAAMMGGFLLVQLWERTRFAPKQKAKPGGDIL